MFYTAKGVFTAQLSKFIYGPYFLIGFGEKGLPPLTPQRLELFCLNIITGLQKQASK
jgi:hypothetical protein